MFHKLQFIIIIHQNLIRSTMVSCLPIHIYQSHMFTSTLMVINACIIRLTICQICIYYTTHVSMLQAFGYFLVPFGTSWYFLVLQSLLTLV